MYKSVLTAIFIILILFSASLAENSQDSVEYYLKEGGQAYLDNEYKQAIHSFESVLSFDSLNQVAIKSLGVIYSETNRVGPAIDYLKQAISLDPTDAAAHNSLAITYLTMSDTLNAIEHYNQALALDSTRGNFAANLALIYFSRQRYSQVISILEPVITRDSTSARAFYLLGRSYLALQKKLECEPNLELAAKLDPRNVEYIYYLAIVKDMLGKVNAAETGYLQAISRDNNHFDAYQRLGVLYIRTDRDADALNMFMQAVALKPESIEANIALGAAQMRNGNTDKAEEIRRWLERRNPQAAEKMTRLGTKN